MTITHPSAIWSKGAPDVDTADALRHYGGELAKAEAQRERDDEARMVGIADLDAEIAELQECAGHGEY